MGSCHSWEWSFLGIMVLVDNSFGSISFRGELSPVGDVLELF